MQMNKKTYKAEGILSAGLHVYESLRIFQGTTGHMISPLLVLAPPPLWVGVNRSESVRHQ